MVIFPWLLCGPQQLRVILRKPQHETTRNSGQQLRTCCGGVLVKSSQEQVLAWLGRATLRSLCSFMKQEKTKRRRKCVRRLAKKRLGASPLLCMKDNAPKIVFPFAQNRKQKLETEPLCAGQRRRILNAAAKHRAFGQSMKRHVPQTENRVAYANHKGRWDALYTLIHCERF